MRMGMSEGGTFPKLNHTSPLRKLRAFFVGISYERKGRGRQGGLSGLICHYELGSIPSRPMRQLRGFCLHTKTFHMSVVE